MTVGASERAVAFQGTRCIANGAIAEVIGAAHAAVERGETEPVLVFRADTSARIDIDMRGTVAEIVARYAKSVQLQDTKGSASNKSAASTQADEPRGPGRPRLGVVGREITLLPRHWEWLASQPGGASVTVRRLVEQARTGSSKVDAVRAARESTYRFMSMLAGDEAGFEEATRALFAGQHKKFIEHTETWPPDVRDHARSLAAETTD